MNTATTTTHTPGPWKHGETTMTRGRIYGGGVLVATLDPPQLQEEVAMKEADARLIAAAPDMLEALKACADPRAFGNLMGGHSYDAEQRAMELVREAIAKATGGEA